MMMQSIPALLAPREGETILDYWASLSPAAPVFGVEWRFAPMFREASQHMTAPAAAGAAVLTEGNLRDEEFEQAVADDLTRLKGVGPKMAAELNDMGLTTFAQLAEMTEANIAELSEKLSAFRDRPVRDDWVGQARALLDARD